jgi:hypothetical protein
MNKVIFLFLSFFIVLFTSIQAQNGDEIFVKDVGGTEYVIHKFTTTGPSTFTPPAGITQVDVLVVGGGIENPTSTSNMLVPEMKISPVSGTDSDLSNAELSSIETFCATQAAMDLATLYDELMDQPSTGTHGVVFGNATGGETLTPGVYDVGGASSITGKLILDGGTDIDNPIFIIRIDGAFTTTVGAAVELTGNARPENIFWLSGQAMSTAAGAIMKGTMIGGGVGAGAVSLGANCNLEGRTFTKLGAISIGAGTILAIPTGPSVFNLRSLSTFAMWSSGGAVSDAAGTSITGDVGTASGALTIGSTHIGNKYFPTVDYCALNPTIWIGYVSTDAADINNWTKGLPDRYIDVLIPSGRPNYPALLANAGAKDLTMQDNTSINLNGNIFAIAGDLTLGTNSTVSGSTPGSDLYFSGTSSQIIPQDFINGPLDILTIKNATDVTNNEDIVLISVLDVITGELVTNGRITLACQFAPIRKTAQVAAVGGTIVGDVTVEQCYPARRAFTFLSPSVTTSTSMRENWQEGVNNTGLDFLTDNKNPNPGYGTHITGSIDGSNGFDATGSGNPSMFTYNNLTPSWNRVTNTNGVLTAGEAYRLFLRGDRSINISLNAAPPTNTRLSATGVLAAGTQTEINLSNTADAFNFIGNPYHAQVDMDLVLKGSVNLRENQYYVWDPTLSTRGAYVTVSRISGNWSNNNHSSNANQYLQPMQSAFVRTRDGFGSASLDFRETDKAVGETQTAVFSQSEQVSIQMGLYPESAFANNEKAYDGLKIVFAEEFVKGHEDDFLKMQNQDENMARLNEGKILSVELRPFPKVEESLPLYFDTYRHSSYILEFIIAEELSSKVFIQDNYLDTLTEITVSENTYSFTIESSIPESVVSDRFSLVFEPESLSIGDENLVNLSLYPNPTKGNFSISGIDSGQDTEVKIYNLIGQQVYTAKSSGQSTLEITDFNGTTGVYLVKLKTNQGEKTFKLIKD